MALVESRPPLPPASGATNPPPPPQDDKEEIPREIQVPPIQIKEIIDKTAGFVKQSGKAMESKILSTEKNNPKFSFLLPTDRYYNYYAWKKGEYKPAPQAAAAPVAPAVVTAPAVVKEVPKAPAVVLDPPPAAEYILDTPDLTAIDIEIIKLTAQFVARNGKGWQVALIKRESQNPQFDFLKGGHPLNVYFNALVDSYTKILLAPRGIIDKLKKDVGDKYALFGRVVNRLEWERQQQAKRDQQALEDKESMGQTIDWHDFIVVATISFEEDEEKPKLTEAPVKEETEMEDEAMELSEDLIVKPDPEMVIRKDYVHNPNIPAALQTQGARSARFTICPRCNQEIPIEEIAEHMKIEYANAQHAAKQKAITQSRIHSSFASDEEIAKNLGRFAKVRSDIFGDKEVLDISKAAKEVAKPDAAVWDGHAGTVAATTSALLQHNAAMPKSSDDAKKLIGPANETFVPGTGPGSTIPPLSQLNAHTPLPHLVALANAPRPAVPYQNPHLAASFPGGQYPMHANASLSLPPQPRGPPMSDDEPSAKKQRTEPQMTEADFFAKFPGTYSISIQVPPSSEKSEWNFNGQVIPVDITGFPL